MLAFLAAKPKCNELNSAFVDLLAKSQKMRSCLCCNLESRGMFCKSRFLWLKQLKIPQASTVLVEGQFSLVDGSGEHVLKFCSLERDYVYSSEPLMLDCRLLHVATGCAIKDRSSNEHDSRVWRCKCSWPRGVWVLSPTGTTKTFVFFRRHEYCTHNRVRSCVL